MSNYYSLVQQITEVSTQLNELRIRLEEKEKQQQLLNSERNTAQSELLTLHKKVQELEHQLSAERQHHQAEKKEKQEMMHWLQRQGVEVVEGSTAKEQVKKLQAELEEKQQVIRTKEAEIENLKEKEDHLLAKIKRLDNLEKDKRSLQEENNNLCSSLQLTMEQLQSLQQELQQGNSERESLKQQLQGALKEVKKRTKQVRKLLSSHEKAMQEVDNLKHDLLSKDAARAVLQAKLEDLDKQAHLKKEIEDQLQQFIQSQQNTEVTLHEMELKMQSLELENQVSLPKSFVVHSQALQAEVDRLNSQNRVQTEIAELDSNAAGVFERGLYGNQTKRL